MKFLCVFKKELRLYFGSFIAYALATAFLVLTGYFFYTDLIFYDLFGDFMDITSSLWYYFFQQDMRFVIMLILPLLTMRLFAEEKKLGTIELLWTYPLKGPHIILENFSPVSLCSLLWLPVRWSTPCCSPLFISLIGDRRSLGIWGQFFLVRHLSPAVRSFHL